MPTAKSDTVCNAKFPDETSAGLVADVDITALCRVDTVESDDGL